MPDARGRMHRTRRACVAACGTMPVISPFLVTAPPRLFRLRRMPLRYRERRPVTATHTDLESVQRLNQARERIMGELRKVIVGQDAVIEQLLTALFGGGHVLLVGVPGLAKTLLISSLARVLDLKFNRIQFTPD